MPEILSWSTIGAIFDMMLVFISLFLTFDTIKTFQEQTRILHEIENKKAQEKFRSRVLLNKALKLLDTQWHLPVWAQYVISFTAAGIVGALSFGKLELLSMLISKAVTLLSIGFTVVTSKRNNHVVKVIRSSDEKVAK